MYNHVYRYYVQIKNYRKKQVGPQTDVLIQNLTELNDFHVHRLPILSASADAILAVLGAHSRMLLFAAYQHFAR